MSGNNRQEAAAATPEENPAVMIVVSAKAVFDMQAAGEVVTDGEALKPGPAFPFVQALMHINERLKELHPDTRELFDITLMTDDPAGVANSINSHGLTINRFLQAGEQPDNNTKLYLSEDPDKVKLAIKEGIAAARIFMPDTMPDLGDTQLRVAFDGDCVLFSDESERITRGQGLQAFFANEERLENQPLQGGPFKGFLQALVKLQWKFPSMDQCPIRTSLVTARGDGSDGNSASPAARARRTLASWRMETNESFFLGRNPKGPVLKTINPHIFFDDQMKHVDSALGSGIIAAHVPYGVCQE